MVAAEEYPALCAAVQVADNADTGADARRVADGTGKCRRVGQGRGCHQTMIHYNS